MGLSRWEADPAPLCIKGDSVERKPLLQVPGNPHHRGSVLGGFPGRRKPSDASQFRRVLRWNRLQTDLLVTFYPATIESVLVHAIPAWSASCTVAERKGLQRVTRTSEKVISCPLSSLESIANLRCLARTRAIIKDFHHPPPPKSATVRHAALREKLQANQE